MWLSDIYIRQMSQQQTTTIFLHSHIDELKQQNSLLSKQLEMLKQANTAMEDKIRHLENTALNHYKVDLQLIALTDQLQYTQQKYQQLSHFHQKQKDKWLQDCSDKDNFIQRLKIEYQKELFKKDEEIKYYKKNMKEKVHKLQQLQDGLFYSGIEDYKHSADTMTKSKLFETEMSRFEAVANEKMFDRKLTEREGFEADEMSTSTLKRPLYQNIMNYSNISSKVMPLSHSCIQSSSNQPNQSNKSSMMKYSKDQIKQLMKTYKKIDKAREEGNKNMSFLKTRKSHINKTVQFDKTVNFDKTVPFDKTNPIDFAS